MKKQSSVRRKALALLLGFVLLCGAFACGAPKDRQTDERPSVVVTIFPQYDFIRAIANDAVRLTMLVKPGSEVHGFDPTFSEVQEILSSDLFVYVGGESDKWVEDVLEKTDAPVNALSLLSMVDTLDEERAESMQGEAEDEPEADEHVWTSPRNAMRIVEALTGALCDLLPEQADTFRKNADAYLAKLQSLDDAFHAVMQSAVRNTVVFADRFPFRYLCAELGLSYDAALPGCSSNEEVSLSTIARLIAVVREQNLPGVFVVEFSDGRAADAVAEATGCDVWLLHSCHNVSKEDFESGVSYLDLMRRNVEALKKAVD